MKQITKKIAALVAAFAFVLTAAFAPALPASAACDVKNGAQAGANCAQGVDTPSKLFGDGSIFTTVVNVLLFIIGALSVVMLVWGGIRYTTSAGNAASVTAAKNTIMYAIIGLVVAFLAYAVVNWVLGQITV